MFHFTDHWNFRSRKFVIALHAALNFFVSYVCEKLFLNVVFAFRWQELLQIFLPVWQPIASQAWFFRRACPALTNTTLKPKKLKSYLLDRTTELRYHRLHEIFNNLRKMT